MDEAVAERTVCVTGLGMVSCMAHGALEHSSILQQQASAAVTRSVDCAGKAIRPIVGLDLEAFIPKPGDRRAMHSTMHYGVAAAGMALRSAQLEGVAGTEIDLIVACDGGDRDYMLDEEIDDKAFRSVPDREALLNQSLMDALRPTLFLAQIPNLLAGNISIVHGPSRSSRTYMGQEIAGAGALRDAFQRVRTGSSDIMLVGGAYSAERPDLLECYEALGLLAEPGQGHIWSVAGRGLVPGSLGAFLVLEPYERVVRSGRTPFAVLEGVTSHMEPREAAGFRYASLASLLDELGMAKDARWGAISGASGLARLSDEELSALTRLSRDYPGFVGMRAPANLLGYGFEAAIFANVVLACGVLQRQALYPPVEAAEADRDRACGPLQKVLVTSMGLCPVAAAVLLDFPTHAGA